jgi:hypothetical protein
MSNFEIIYLEQNKNCWTCDTELVSEGKLELLELSKRERRAEDEEAKTKQRLDGIKWT